MTDLTPERLLELRRIAEAATPGPWDTTRYNGGLRFDGPLRVYAGTDPEYGEPRPIPATDADTRYIAAFDPPTVLALLDEIERLRRERKEADGMSGLTATAPEMSVFGMTMRDFFAAKAMAALIAEPASKGWTSTVARWANQVQGHAQMSGPDIVAHVAYMMADAMLRAREQQPRESVNAELLDAAKIARDALAAAIKAAWEGSTDADVAERVIIKKLDSAIARATGQEG